MTAMRTVEEHRTDILAAVTPLSTEEVATADAGGRTLASSAAARVDVPPFDNSAMDGFAVRFADVSSAGPEHPAILRVVADLPAGTDADPVLKGGQAARIMTGAPVPTGADTIVPFEDTAGGLGDSLVTATVQAAPRTQGAFVRRQGEDLRAGDEVLPAGTALGPRQVAALMAAGIDRVRVAARPRVVIISTGDELVPVGGPMRRGQIPESNSGLLAGLVTGVGAVTVRHATVGDDGAALAALVAEVTAADATADAVIMTGGVSAGAYEAVRIALPDLAFRSVAMQPGKPQAFGVIGRTLVFGLPGNPVSAAVCFEVFVRPALLAMQQRTDLFRPPLRLAAGAGWRTPPGRRQYLPVRFDRTDPTAWRVLPASSGGSHLAASLGRAEGYAVVPAEVAEVQPGDVVDVIVLES